MPGAPSREVVAIGTEALIAGFALVGVRLVPAVSAGEVRTAWQRALATAGVVILTPAAAEVLAQDRTGLHAPPRMELRTTIAGVTSSDGGVGQSTRASGACPLARPASPMMPSQVASVGDTLPVVANRSRRPSCSS